MTELPIETARHMLLHGLGASFLTRATVAEELANGRVVEVKVEDLPAVYRESALVCLKRTLPLNTVLQEFVRTLKEEGRELAHSQVI